MVLIFGDRIRFCLVAVCVVAINIVFNCVSIVADVVLVLLFVLVLAAALVVGVVAAVVEP